MKTTYQLPKTNYGLADEHTLRRLGTAHQVEALDQFGRTAAQAIKSTFHKASWIYDHGGPISG